MLCKDNMANLDFKSKKNKAKHIFPSFSLNKKKLTKKTQHEMHECYAMQILKTKKTKTIKMKGHKEQRDKAQ